VSGFKLATDLTGCTGSNCLDRPSTLNLPNITLDAGATNIVNTLITAAAVLAVIFLVLGGIRYITSNGDPGRTAQAKQTLTYAIIGLIIAIMARLIVGFVLQSAPQ
jgi:FtsH-binding integral membrane protein